MNTLFKKMSLFGDDKEQTYTLQKVFERAGVIDENFKSNNTNISEGLSILIVNENGDLNNYETLLKKMNSGITNGSLKHGFIWHPESKFENKGKLESLISSHLSREITYSRHPFVIRFVEDVIKTMETEQKNDNNNQKKDLSVFYNIFDDQIGSDTCDMLTDIFDINKISVDNSENDLDLNIFSTLALEAKLIVIIFNQNKEWAEIFAQEIWKKIGGVSSGIPILLIGSSSGDQSKISIPNITCVEVAKELLALEVKVQYDSLIKG